MLDIPSFVFPLDKCARFHHHLPYKWQILQKDGTTWDDLLNEEEVEKEYCSPANVLWYEKIHIYTQWYFNGFFNNINVANLAFHHLPSNQCPCRNALSVVSDLIYFVSNKREGYWDEISSIQLVT